MLTIVSDDKEYGEYHEETKRLKSYTENLTQLVPPYPTPPGFLNLYTLRHMRNAHLPFLLSKVYHTSKSENCRSTSTDKPGRMMAI